MSTGEQINELVRAAVKALAWIRFEPIEGEGEDGGAIRLHLDTPEFNRSHSWVGENLAGVVAHAYEAVRAGDVYGVAVAVTVNGAGSAGGDLKTNHKQEEG